MQRTKRKVQMPLPGKLRAAEYFVQPACFGFGLANDEHLLTGAGIVQFVADFGDIFNRQVVSIDPAATAEAATEGKR